MTDDDGGLNVTRRWDTQVDADGQASFVLDAVLTQYNGHADSSEEKALMLDTLFFDLDGTLVDSRAGVVHAVAAGVREALTRHGHADFEPQEALIIGALGLPSAEYFRAVLPEELHQLAPEAQACSTEHEVRALAAGEGRLFPEVLETLDLLREQGCRLGVISNAQQGYFRAALEHLGVNERLDYAECYEEMPPPTEMAKVALLRRALAALDADPTRCAMVGDRREDVVAGNQLGCRSIGALYGFGSPEELSVADFSMESFVQLPSCLN
jgi:phosphoglycolate phosphatase